MLKSLLLLFLCSCVSLTALSQTAVDTLAFQDFEVAPAAPVWTFTGPVIYNSGFSTASAAPPSSPIGIGGSRAWETTTNSGGLILDFANVSIPVGYDSIRFHFNLAAMNLNASSGGPDDLDYVLVAVSTDGGTTYYNRMRIRGAVNNNSFWAYSATGVGKVYYQPQTEALFQPINTGLATTLGYSNCEIVFPGSVTQVRIRMTGRSSSSSDTWLVDNMLVTGEACQTGINNAATICNGESYLLPGGGLATTTGTYQDTLPAVSGCDTIVTTQLTVLPAYGSMQSATICAGEAYLLPGGGTATSAGTYNDTLQSQTSCDSAVTTVLSVLPQSGSATTADICDGDSYLLPGGGLATASGIYSDTLVAANTCDSIVITTLTVHAAQSQTITASFCEGTSYLLPGGASVTVPGIYVDTLASVFGCDSVLSTNLSQTTVDTSVTPGGASLSANQSGATYQWLDCANNNTPVPGATQQVFSPGSGGVFSVVVQIGGCSGTSGCHTAVSTGLNHGTGEGITVGPSPFHEEIIVRGLPVDLLPVARLFDLQGRSIAIATVLEGGLLRVRCGGLAIGTYFLSLEGIGTYRVVHME